MRYMPSLVRGSLWNYSTSGQSEKVSWAGSVTPQLIILVWLITHVFQITQPFELYISVSPMLPKSAVVSAANSVMRWVKKEEARLFLRDAPVFWLEPCFQFFSSLLFVYDLCKYSSPTVLSVYAWDRLYWLINADQERLPYLTSGCW